MYLRPSRLSTIAACRSGARSACSSRVIAVALLGIAFAAIDDAWPVAFAAGVLGAWMGTMAFRALAR